MSTLKHQFIESESFETVAESLAALKNAKQGRFTFVGSDGFETSLSFRDLHSQVRQVASSLHKNGIRSGQMVGVVLPEAREFTLTFLSLIYMGAIPVPLYPPTATGRIESYCKSTAKIFESCQARAVVTADILEPIMRSATRGVRSLRRVLSFRTIWKTQVGQNEFVEATKPAADDLCFLQYTSGSTSHPKGVMVSHRNIVANANAFLGAIGADPDKDIGLSWLPLHHDMGLIGFVLGPILHRIPVVFLSTLGFLRDPSVWLREISERRATITYAPNFAYSLVSRRMSDEDIEGLDLSSLRIAGCGAEPIQAETLERFADRFSKCGFNRKALVPSYGMAEATLGISFASHETDFGCDVISRSAYETGSAMPIGAESSEAMRIVSCGHVLEGHDVQVRSPSGAVLSDRMIGEIWFRGPSVSSGYFGNEEATQSAFQGGWLATGDLGYLVNGQVYVSGRKKDLLIINGRNIYPQSIEWEVEQIDAVRAGNVVAFSVPGEESESVAVVFESSQSGSEKVVEEVRTRLQSAFGLNVSDILMLDPGQLPKTTSGKIQRQKTRKLYLESRLEHLKSRHDVGVAAQLSYLKHSFLGNVLKAKEIMTKDDEQ